MTTMECTINLKSVYDSMVGYPYNIIYLGTVYVIVWNNICIIYHTAVVCISKVWLKYNILLRGSVYLLV